MIYYTSDLHLGHANIIKLCKRPFKDVDEMNRILIDNWNRRVTNGDTIYIMGDLCFRAADAENLIKQLNGRKHLIVGNHDKSWMKKVELDRYFESVDRMLVFGNGKSKVTLCHYPMMSYDGDYLIFGHIHNNKIDTYWPLLRTMEKALNAGVEINGYKPVTFEEMIENNVVFRNERF